MTFDETLCTNLEPVTKPREKVVPVNAEQFYAQTDMAKKRNKRTKQQQEQEVSEDRRAALPPLAPYKKSLQEAVGVYSVLDVLVLFLSGTCVVPCSSLKYSCMHNANLNLLYIAHNYIAQHYNGVATVVYIIIAVCESGTLCVYLCMYDSV